MGMHWYDWIFITLLIVGGLNWGLVGFFDFNLVYAIFGNGMLTRFIYDLVGISAIVSTILLALKD